MAAAIAMKRLHVVVSGAVQGVWFRESTREEADRHGVAGWVRNLPDGRVEAAFEGPVPAVEAMVAWCRRGPPNARVDRVEAVPEEPRGIMGPFRVLR
ncbi:MAG: acylphosphatase [Thermoplasmatota archaeon]